MEKQLFTWGGCEQMDTADFLFYDCELKVDIDSHKKGTKFKSVILSYENGTLTFQNDNGEEIKQVKLEFKVV